MRANGKGILLLCLGAILVLAFGLGIGACDKGGGGDSDAGADAGPDLTPGTATVTADPASGAAPLQVSFTCTPDQEGELPLSYYWDFGDGGDSAAISPGHTYVAYGAYTVSCMVTDGGGKVFAGSANIEVEDPELAEGPVIDSVSADNGWAALGVSTLATCGIPNQTAFQMDVEAHDQHPEGVGADAGDQLTYQWVIESAPDLETKDPAGEFSNPDIRNPIFRPYYPGDFVLRVMVSDNIDGTDDTKSTVTADITVTAKLADTVTLLTDTDEIPVAGELFPVPLIFQVTNGPECNVPGLEVETQVELMGGAFIAKEPTIYYSSNVEGKWGEVDVHGIEVGCGELVVSATAHPVLPESHPANLNPVEPVPAEFHADISAGAPYYIWVDMPGGPVSDAEGRIDHPYEVYWADICGTQVDGEAAVDVTINVSGNGFLFPGDVSSMDVSVPVDGYSTTVSGPGAGWVDGWVSNLPAGANAGGLYTLAVDIDTTGQLNGPWMPWDQSPYTRWGWPWSNSTGWYTYDDLLQPQTVGSADYYPPGYPEQPGWWGMSYIYGFNSIPCTGGPVHASAWTRTEFGGGANWHLAVEMPPVNTSGEPNLDWEAVPPLAGYEYDTTVTVDGIEVPGWGGTNGWHEVQWDLSKWACDTRDLYASVTVDADTEASGGVAVNDFRFWYNGATARSRFTAGPFSTPSLSPGASAMMACEDVPAYLTVYTWDSDGNETPDTDVTLTFSTAVTATDAFPGTLVSQSDETVVVSTGIEGRTFLFFTHGTTATVTVNAANAAGGVGATTSFDLIAEAANEIDACDDLLDNDCDGFVDCDDSDCFDDIACQADLTFASYYNTLDIYWSSQYIYWGYDVYNATDFAAGPYDVALYIMPDGALPSGTPFWTYSGYNGVPYSGLAAWSYEPNDGPGSASTALIAGIYDAYLVVDHTDTVTESNETNNSYTESIYVYADLEVYGSSHTAVWDDGDSELDVTFYYQNTSANAAGPFDVVCSVYDYGDDPDIDPALGSATVSDADGIAGYAVNATLTANIGSLSLVEDTAYEVYCALDSGSDVLESDDTDNLIGPIDYTHDLVP